jgi:hypothetical protein
VGGRDFCVAWEPTQATQACFGFVEVDTKRGKIVSSIAA